MKKDFAGHIEAITAICKFCDDCMEEVPFEDCPNEECPLYKYTHYKKNER